MTLKLIDADKLNKEIADISIEDLDHENEWNQVLWIVESIIESMNHSLIILDYDDDNLWNQDKILWYDINTNTYYIWWVDDIRFEFYWITEYWERVVEITHWQTLPSLPNNK